jgi:type II secretory pathway component PulF
MMNLKDIYLSSRSLASQFRGNIPMPEAMSNMEGVQPGYAEFWASATRSVEAGNPVSASLREVWPAPLVGAVEAGEESGKMVAVFTRITKTTKAQLELRRLFAKLGYPIGICLVGVVLFFVILIFLVPLSANHLSARRAQPTGITLAALTLSTFAKNYWLIILGGVAAAGVALLQWANTPEGKETLLSWALAVPIFGGGISLIYYGIWAEYMAMLYSAGISIDRALLLTVKVLPEQMRKGFELLHTDISVNSLDVAAAVNLKNLKVDDPRREWPQFILNAMRLGTETGDFDGELMTAAPELHDDGLEKIGRFSIWSEILSIAFAASLLGMCFLAIYLPMFSTMKRLH